MGNLDVARLESLDFFRHVRAADLARVRSEAARRAYPLLDETHRVYLADAEDLAEGGVLDFLGTVAPFLRREGVPIDVVYRVVKYPATRDRPAGRTAARLDADGWVDESGPLSRVESLRVAFARGAELCEVTDDFEDGDGYSLFAGGREIVIYRAEEGAFWTSATVATRTLLGELLAAHGSDERAYAISGGNELRIAVATPAMARLINAAISEPRDRLHDGEGNEAS